MSNYSETTPLEKRSSKYVTVGQFFKETWPVPAAWVGGVLLGVMYSKMKGYKFGTPAAQFAMMIPAKVGAFAALFLMWRKKEAEHIGIAEIYNKYKGARALRMDNAAIEKDNAMLRKMLEYEERQMETPQHLKDIIEQGKRSHSEHAEQLASGMVASR